MKEETRDKIIRYIPIILLLCVCLIISFILLDTYENVQNRKLFCKENGFEEYSYNDVLGGVCYKEIPHESGVGVQRIYSGRVDI